MQDQRGTRASHRPTASTVRRLPALALLPVLLILAACGGEDDAAPPSDLSTTSTSTASTTTALPSTTTSTTTTTTPTTTTTTTSTTPTSDGADAAGSTETLTEPPPDPSTLPGGVLEPCDSPLGFSISRPQSWTTNPGAVVPACSQFHPEPFTVPPASDQRVAAITARVDPVPFVDVATADRGPDVDRAVTAVDGLQAVRLAYTSDGEGLWPVGTPITRYAIDLSPEPGDGQGTLFLDTVGLPGFQYEQNQVILDRMVQTLRVTRADVATDPQVVALYGGGGGGFSVIGELVDGRPCLRLPLDKEGPCAPSPGPYEVQTLRLVDLEPLLAGVTGGHVFRVTAEREDGTTSSVLPAEIGDTDIRGFAFPFDLTEVNRLTAFDVTGRQVARLEPGGR